MTEEPSQKVRLFEQMIDAAPAGFCIVGLDGRFQRVNPYFCQLLGYNSDELSKLTFAELTHPQDVSQDSIAFQKMLKGELSTYQTEKRYLHKNGTAIWVDLTSSLLHDEQNKPMHFVTVLQNITRRKKAEEDLSKSEQRFRTLFQQAPFSAQLLATDGRTLKVNTAWENTFKLPEGFLESYIYKEYNILQDPLLEKKGVISYLKAAFAGESVFIDPILYDPAEVNRPGQASWLAAFVHPIKNEKGEVIEVMLIHQDFTDRIEFEKKLKESKEAAESANRLKSAFLANMSHEIRTPLGAILGFTDLLKDDKLPATDRHRYLAIIERSGKSLVQIINDILDLSRVEAGSLVIQKSEVRLREVVKDVLDLLQVEAKKRNLTLSLDVEPLVPEFVTTDPVRLKQILINLVGNAMKFTKQGSISVTVQSDSDNLSIAVVDTGIGIDTNDRDWLFKPFSQLDASHTRRFGGTGLGLALSKRLALALGGDIQLAHSALNVGSTFVVTIPNTSLNQMPAEVELYESLQLEETEERSLENLRILIVEDSDDNRLLLHELLLARDAIVDIATNGKEAVERVEHDNFDVVLMDIQMPVKDGLIATSEIRKKGIKTPIIALTAHAMHEEVLKSIEAGCNAHLSKPVTTQILIRTIMDQVGVKQ